MNDCLRSEMTVLRKLRHVNIVNYRGIEHEGNKLCLFMELCPGGSISTVLSSFGRLSINVVRRYTHQILSGLDYLHRHSIVHRDIKTANALLNRDGIVKLADFGGATTLSELGSGSLYGTARYLAPEVLNGGKMGRQLDIWAVGCLVVEMFTNRSPFSDQFSNDLTLMRQLRALKHSPAVPKDVPSEAVPFIEQCLRCNPAQRPSAHGLLKHSFLHQSLDEEAAIVSNASTGNSENTGTWNVEIFYAMTAMHPGRDPHLLEIKNWITTHRDEIMLLVRSGFVEGSWNWVAMLRFLWAKSTVISSRVASSIPSVRGRKRPSVRRRRDRNAAREKPIGRQLLPLKTPAVEGRDFSCELEAKYNKWLEDNTRCRLGRGTTLARSVLALGVFRLLVDVFLSNFQVTSSFERHRLDVIWCLFVSVFACIPFIPHRLVNGCMYAWRALALVIGLGICCISFFQVMAWWHISSLAFFVFCLSGALPVKDALSLSILLSCIHLINIVVHFQHGSRGQFHVSQPGELALLSVAARMRASLCIPTWRARTAYATCNSVHVLRRITLIFRMCVQPGVMSWIREGHVRLRSHCCLQILS